MKKTVTLCDRCSRECNHESIFVVVGTQRQTTGEEDDVVEDVDLCPLCLRVMLDRMVKEMPLDKRQEWVKAARTKLVPVRR